MRLWEKTENLCQHYRPTGRKLGNIEKCNFKRRIMDEIGDGGFSFFFPTFFLKKAKKKKKKNQIATQAQAKASEANVMEWN